MTRYYRLSKQISKEQAAKIEKEMEAVEIVRRFTVTDDFQYVMVETEEEAYPVVMSKVVNICRRVADKAELSFHKFAD